MLLPIHLRPIPMAIAGVVVPLSLGLCAAIAPATEAPKPIEAQAIARSPLTKQSATDANLPMPDDARNISRLPSPGTGSLNFQTNLSLPDALAFYRQRMTQRGLRERAAHTTLSASTFTISFEGWPNSNALLMVEGTDLGGVVTNVNIYFAAP